jgi:hypothetical protein
LAHEIIKDVTGKMGVNIWVILHLLSKLKYDYLLLGIN